MIKRQLPLLFVTALGLCCPALAVEVERFAPPAAVVKSLPKGARTWFRGRVPAEKTATPDQHLYLNLYAVPAPRKRARDAAVYRCTLDIWQQIGSGQWRRLRSMPLEQSTFDGLFQKKNFAYTRFRAMFDWTLDSKRDSPVIVLNITVGRASYTSDGRDVVYVFPGGFANPPKIQKFAEMERPESGTLYTIQNSNPEGVLRAYRNDWINDPYALTSHSHTTYQWDGNSFVAMGSPSPYESVLGPSQPP